MIGGRRVTEARPDPVSVDPIHAPIDAVVFDIRGVLLDWNPRYLYRKLFDDEAEMEYFLSAVCTPEWHHDNDLGVPMETTCGRLAAAHPEYAEQIWAWGRRSEEMIAGPLEETVAVLRELRDAGVRCYALTNMESWTFPLREARFPFFGWFAGIVVSGHEGLPSRTRRSSAGCSNASTSRRRGRC